MDETTAEEINMMCESLSKFYVKIAHHPETWPTEKYQPISDCNIKLPNLLEKTMLRLITSVQRTLRGHEPFDDNALGCTNLILRIAFTRGSATFGGILQKITAVVKNCSYETFFGWIFGRLGIWKIVGAFGAITAVILFAS